MMKKWMAVLFAVMMLVANAAMAQDKSPFIQYSGTCGDNLTWTINSQNVLTISGSGAMYDYDSTNVPWDDHKEVIREIRFDGEITHIGEYAFYNCEVLTEITIPGSVKSVGGWSFFNCLKLTKVILEEGIEDIGNLAFCNCGRLKIVKIPDSVREIGIRAFSACFALENITLSERLTELPVGVFEYCERLASVELPKSVTKIEVSAFDNCDALESVFYSGYQTDAVKIRFGNDNVDIKKAIWHYQGTDVPKHAVDGVIGNKVDELGNKPVNVPSLIVSRAYGNRFQGTALKYCRHEGVYDDGKNRHDKANTITYNVHLLDKNGWEVDLPGKCTLILPYPSGINQRNASGYSFTITHYGHRKTEVFKSESDSIECLPQGLAVRVDEFSPFVMEWETVSTNNLPKTGDDSNLALWSTVIALCFAVSVTRKRRIA